MLHAFKNGPAVARLSTAVGSEGGVAPGLASRTDALYFIMKSVERDGDKPGDDVGLSLDCASTEFFKDGAYRMEGEGTTLSPREMADYLADLTRRYPILSIEDGMAEDDFDGWKALTDLKIGRASCRERVCQYV